MVYKGFSVTQVEELSMTRDGSFLSDIWMEEGLMIHEWRKGLV